MRMLPYWLLVVASLLVDFAGAVGVAWRRYVRGEQS